MAVERCEDTSSSTYWGSHFSMYLLINHRIRLADEEALAVEWKHWLGVGVAGKAESPIAAKHTSSWTYSPSRLRFAFGKIGKLAFADVQALAVEWKYWMSVGVAE